MNTYKRIISELEEKADLRFKAFSEKIMNSPRPLLGVKIPEVRIIAKRLLKDGYGDYLNECEFKYFEDSLIFGIVTANLPEDEFYRYLPVYLGKCDCWADVDVFVPEIKIARKKETKERLYRFAMENIGKSRDFNLRFYIVLCMRWYLSEDKIDEVLSAAKRLTGRGYYNDMAIAWLLSAAYVKYPEKTELVLRDCSDKTVTKMTVRKICDSYRVGEEDKKRIKERLWTK